MDGTIADGNHRVHHLYPKEKRNWDAFYAECDQDTPHEDVICMVNALKEAGHTIVILTGRREETRKETQRWLEHYSVYYDLLIMRPVGFHGDDHLWKPDMLSLLGGTMNIMMVIEDRNRIVTALRQQGYRVIQVADGDF